MEEQQAEHSKQPEEMIHPQGALALTLAFLVVMAALWLIVYFQLIGGGATR